MIAKVSSTRQVMVYLTLIAKVSSTRQVMVNMTLLVRVFLTNQLIVDLTLMANCKVSCTKLEIFFMTLLVRQMMMFLLGLQTCTRLKMVIPTVRQSIH